MTELIIKIILGIISLYFIVSEAYYIVNLSNNALYDIFTKDSTLFLIIIIEFILIVFILPILYFFKLLDWWSEGGVEYEFFQTELFYKGISAIISILIILRIIEQILK